MNGTVLSQIALHYISDFQGLSCTLGDYYSCSVIWAGTQHIAVKMETIAFYFSGVVKPPNLANQEESMKYGELLLKIKHWRLLKLMNKFSSLYV